MSETVIGLTDSQGIAFVKLVADGKIVLLLNCNGTIVSEWSTDGQQRSYDPKSVYHRR